MALELIQSRVHLAVVQLLRAFTNRLEQQRLGVQLRVDTKDIQNDSRGCTIVTTTDDVSVTDNEDELPFVVVLESRERVDRTPKGVFTLSVTRHLAKDKLVLHFRTPLAREL